MNNPWEKLGQGYFRRQDIDINAFYAKNETGKYLFIIDLEELLDKDIELSLKGIDLKTAVKDKSSFLTLILKNENNWEIFLQLCEDLMFSAKSIKSNRAKKILSRLIRWQTFLKNETNSISEEIQIGLMGELIFLNEYLSRWVSLEQAINAWVGPEKEKQDFRINGTSIEIKSFMDKKQDQVNISSIEQLNNNDNNLYLCTIGFKSSDDGETLEDYCKKIQKRIYEECPSALSAFEDLLISYGYYSHCKYDNLKKLSPYKNCCYNVNNEFPKIPITIKNPAILNVNYKLDLSYCREFLVEIKDMMELIK